MEPHPQALEGDVQATELRDRLDDWDAGDRPRYQALADRLMGLADTGELPPGMQLPPERALAETLDVSRGTIVRAYGVLRDEGRAVTRHGSGTVIDADDVSPGSREAHVAEVLPADSIYSFLDGPVNRGASIDLRGAHWNDATPIPASALERFDEDVRDLLMTPGYAVAGLPSLREALAAHLTNCGLPTESDEVLPTTGAMQAINLVAQLRLAPGDLVVTEEQSYPGALDAFRMLDAQLAGVQVGRDGADIGQLRAALRRRPSLVYLQPSGHNPTGRTMPAAARTMLVDALAETETVVIDDLTMAEMWWDEPPPPPLAAHPRAPNDRILTVGSLSKSIWGGLRVGWIRGPRPSISRLARLKASTDLSSSLLSQALAVRLLPHHDAIVEDKRQALRDRSALVAELLHEHLPEWSWVRPQGGLSLWIDLAWGTSTEFAPYALRNDVGIAPSSVHDVHGRSRHRLRFPVTRYPDVLVAAVERLGLAWQEYRSETRRHGAASVVI
jgi:DNA-binding transcriptional MocR family regulator